MRFGADVDPSWMLVDTVTAARLARVQPGTIRVWAARGRIHRAGTRKRALWDLREVLACAKTDRDTT